VGLSVRTRFYVDLQGDGDMAANKAQLIKLLQDANLAPSFDEAEIVRRKEDLLKEVPEARRELLRRSIVTTVFEPMYASWGIVSTVSGSVYELRMANPYSFRIQASVARVVSALRAKAAKQKIRLTFKPEVEIFESNDDQAAYQATILDRRLWKLARGDKRVSWRIFLVASWIALIGIVMTMPGAPQLVFRDVLGWSPAWATWGVETLGRCAAAALVAAATALLDVYLHWRHLQGVAPVVWPLEGQR
jgi:hypothetical protein